MGLDIIAASADFYAGFSGARFLVDGDVPVQAGNNHPTSIHTGVFKTADGFMNMAVAGEEIWKRFARAMDRADWIDNPLFEIAAARSENREQLNAEIEALTITRATAEWIERLNAAVVPCGEINDIGQVFDDPQVQHLGIAQTVESHERGATQLIGQPIQMSRTPSTISSPPPLAGEHSDSILRSLGYDDVGIERLREDGCI